MTRPLGREVRPPQAYGGYYSQRLSRGRYVIKLYAPGNRRDPDVYVSIQRGEAARDAELAALREGCEL